MKNSTLCFPNPNSVLTSRDLTKDEKIELLKEWEYDLLDTSVAEEENMRGKDYSELLRQIKNAIIILQNNSNNRHKTAPNKQGGRT